MRSYWLRLGKCVPASLGGAGLLGLERMGRGLRNNRVSCFWQKISEDLLLMVLSTIQRKPHCSDYNLFKQSKKECISMVVYYMKNKSVQNQQKLNMIVDSFRFVYMNIDKRIGCDR